MVARGAEQQAHLKYLQGLWESKKALAVGPLEGAGRMRGLVILDVPTRDDAKAILGKDPRVQLGHFSLDVLTFWCEPGYFLHQGGFMELEKHYFGFLVRPASAPKLDAEESKRIQEGHMANLNRMASLGILKSAGPFDGGKRYRGVVIFRGADPERIQREVGEDPAVKAGLLKLQLYPWWTSRGNFAL